MNRVVPHLCWLEVHHVNGLPFSPHPLRVLAELVAGTTWGAPHASLVQRPATVRLLFAVQGCVFVHLLEHNILVPRLNLGEQGLLCVDERLGFLDRATSGEGDAHRRRTVLVREGSGLDVGTHGLVPLVLGMVLVVALLVHLVVWLTQDTGQPHAVHVDAFQQGLLKGLVFRECSQGHNFKCCVVSLDDVPIVTEPRLEHIFHVAGIASRDVLEVRPVAGQAGCFRAGLVQYVVNQAHRGKVLQHPRHLTHHTVVVSFLPQVVRAHVLVNPGEL